MPAGAELLELTGICKRFGGVRALRGVNMRLSTPGVVHALVGENGSGKSTLLGILCGLVSPDSGLVRFRGEEIKLDRPAEAVRRGIVAVSQETAVAGHLSVTENMLMGRLPRRRGLISWGAAHDRAAQMLAHLGMVCDPAALVSTLRPDERQLVEIGRALAMDPHVLILDEPTSSLTEDEVEVVLRAIRRLKERDVATILVTHRLEELFAVADELTVLRDGETVAAGSSSDFDPQKIVAAMVGSADYSPTASSPVEGRTTPSTRPPPALRVRNLAAPGFSDVSFDLYPGEILGVAGLVGSGRGELLKAIFGVAPVTAGAMEAAGNAYSPNTPADSIAAGFGYVPPDRKTDGLVLKMTVRDNMAMVLTAAAHGLKRDDGNAAPMGEILRRLRVATRTLPTRAGTLSGGNQQKIAVAKWLLKELKVLLLAEPTRGVDVVSRQQLHGGLRDLAASGVALVVSSSENPEVLELCDRVLIMSGGGIVRDVERDDLDEHRLTALCGGHEGDVS